MRSRGFLMLLNNAPLVLFALVLGVFGSLSDRFLDAQNLRNILVQSSALVLVATGMTFVLLTAGVDLSAGSVMFIAVAVGGKCIYEGHSLGLGFAGGLITGVLLGGVNAWFITRLRVVPFIATLALLFVGRGFGLWYTNTRAMNLPSAVTHLGTQLWLGVPLPLWVMGGVVLAAHMVLTRTAFGIQVYAVGNDPEAARKAGIRVERVLAAVYVISGFCAALSGLVALTQTGAVSPSFGQQREFSAIAAAVLGGTSLFGGRGGVLPGTLLGAMLIQTIENGLVIVNADPYLHPLVTSAIIFVAVLLDATRSSVLARLRRRRIRPLED